MKIAVGIYAAVGALMIISFYFHMLQIYGILVIVLVLDMNSNKFYSSHFPFLRLQCSTPEMTQMIRALTIYVVGINLKHILSTLSQHSPSAQHYIYVLTQLIIAI